MWPKPTVPEPSIDRLIEMELDEEYEATDGCRVDPDGTCPDGHPSWALVLGVI